MAISPERLHQIEELYHSARELLPEEQEGLLKEACGNDTELLRDVLVLLAQDASSGPLERSVLGIAGNLLADARWIPGAQIGPYQIVSRLGEGGMGDVFKARDTRLGREVAIKIAHEEFSGRFLRDAQTISALNHPNICTLFDIGPNYLVMEMVEGANLAGPVPIDTAIAYARQIAAGLEAAHERGIIHRDLKPANIRVTPEDTVKILDFGLAKSSESATGWTTVTMTEKGTILGTAAYMAPEQARGEAVDKRVDIWAFGVVLYELLTGEVLFGGGRSASDAIAAVLTREPDFNVLPRGTPARVRRLLELCMRKDPKQRLRDIGDARILLDELEAEAPRPTTRRWLWATSFAASAALAAFLSYRLLTEPPDEPFQRIQVTKLTDSGNASAAAISPDGKYVLHAVTDEGKSSLWLLHAATGSNVQILPPVATRFSSLSFSRDGNSLYYFFNTETGPAALYNMPLLGGTAKMVAAFPGVDASTFAATDHTALSPGEDFVSYTRRTNDDLGLFIAGRSGGGERRLRAAKGAYNLVAPTWSPDGKIIAYSPFTRVGPSSTLMATPVDGGSERAIGFHSWYYITGLGWMPNGHGLIAAASAQWLNSQLWHVSYPDGKTRRITNDLNNYLGVSLTGDASGLVTVQSEQTSHLWSVELGDPEGARQITTGRLDGLGGLAWSADGRLYFEAPDANQDTQIWISAPDGSGRRQITTERLNGKPAPCGGGRYLVFLSFRAGIPHIWRSDPDGGNVLQLTNGAGEASPDCSPDGLWLTFGYAPWIVPAPPVLGVWRLPIDGGQPMQIWNRPGWSRISPDGKNVLVGDGTGKVAIVPADGGQARSLDHLIHLSRAAGLVAWAPDGASLLYVQTTGGVSNIWRQPLDGGEAKSLTNFTSLRITWFDVSRDGKKLALARGSIASDVVLIRDLK